MKKITGILLLVCFLATTTEVHELFKIPGLFEHYMEHSANNDNSITDFIYDHYFSNSPHQDDDGDEENLPFKDHGKDACITFITYNFYIDNHPTVVCIQTVASSTQFQLYSESALSNYQCHIWQPPKIG